MILAQKLKFTSGQILIEGKRSRRKANNEFRKDVWKMCLDGKSWTILRKV